MVHEFQGANERSLARLEEIVRRLTPADLERTLPDGWTVMAALAHLAWWDRYAAIVLRWWAAEGYQQPPDIANLVNATALPEWRALPAAYVREEVPRAARAMDDAVAAAPPDLVERVVADGRARYFDRSIHRDAHIDQIESGLVS